MAKVIITEQYLEDIADAIRAKNGSQDTYYPSEMAGAIEAISRNPVLQSKTYNVSSAGTTTVTADNGYDGLSSVVVSVSQADPYITMDYGYYTENNVRKWKTNPRAEVVVSEGDTAGWVADGFLKTGEGRIYSAISTGTTVTPTESAQTIGGANYMMEGAVTINAISSTYVGSGITRCDSSDVEIGGDTVYVSPGYYALTTEKAIPSGTAGTPTATKGTVSNHQVSVTPSVTNTAGYISGGTKTGTAVTVSASELVSGTLSITSSGTKDVTNYASASVGAGTEGTPTATKGTVSNHSISVTPKVTNSAGYITGSTKTGTAVTVSASELVSGTYTVDSSGTKDVTNYANASVPAGTAGTPSASKGAVSNHSVSVTPSVTNTTGWITGSTKTGTAVTVTASELASGNKAITQNGTGIDVVGYSTVSVNVEGVEYTRTVIVPQQTVTPNSSRVATLNTTGTINDAENYIVTLDGVEWFATSETLWSSNYIIGDPNWYTGTPSTYIYPFAVGREGSITDASFANANQHTIKVERLDFVEEGTTLTTKNITANGTYNASSDSADGYTSVTVNVPTGTPTIQSLSITPTTSQQTFNASDVDGYKPVTVAAMPTMTLPTTAASSATSGYTSKATIGRSTAAQYINIPPGYNSTGAYYVITAVADGSATAPASISGTAASVSTGTNTLTLTKTVSVTPTVSAGYVSAGTAGNSSVSLTASVTTKAAATITPTTTNQTIAAGTYLTGTQTIAGDADLVGGNILSTANIFGVQGTVDFIDVYIRSAAPTSSVGNDGDIYIQE